MRLLHMPSRPEAHAGFWFHLKSGEFTVGGESLDDNVKQNKVLNLCNMIFPCKTG